MAVVSIARLKPEFYGLPPDEALLHQWTLKEGSMSWVTPIAWDTALIRPGW